ncbi:MAG TPA: hypothetical protein ENI99_11580 [Sedimenticola sp.]|nr:hypothetical protein [Sedimenticola sp.]
MYVEGSVQALARFFMSNAYFQQKMTGKICYNAVLYCLRVASMNGFYNRDDFASPDEATRVLFTQAPNPVQHSRIRADCVVGIFRKQLQNQPFSLSHVMISIDGIGNCIGSNNGAIGGPGNWNTVNIAQKLTWRPQRNPVFDDPAQRGAPEWAKERVVLVKPIRELLNMV